MTDEVSNLLPTGIRDAIGQAAALNQSNDALPDRRSHSQRLGEGMFKAAANFAGNYKQHYPEAYDQVTRIAAFAFKPKPAGYVEYIDRLVTSWLTGSTRNTETNAATVQRIRDRFPNHSFADSLLNKPLSKKRREKIAANATEQGYKIDTRQHDTLSKIKAAALKGERATIADRRIQINATLTDTYFAGLKIELHSKRQSVRFTHDGKRRRIYIDDLIILSEWLAGDDTGECSSNLLLRSIETLAPETGKPVETRQEVSEADTICTDPLSDCIDLPELLAPETGKLAENLNNNRECLTGNIGPGAPEPTMTERIAALRANLPADEPPAYASDFDPLCNT